MVILAIPETRAMIGKVQYRFMKSFLKADLIAFLIACLSQRWFLAKESPFPESNLTIVLSFLYVQSVPVRTGTFKTNIDK